MISTLCQLPGSFSFPYTYGQLPTPVTDKRIRKIEDALSTTSPPSPSPLPRRHLLAAQNYAATPATRQRTTPTIQPTYLMTPPTTETTYSKFPFHLLHFSDLDMVGNNENIDKSAATAFQSTCFVWTSQCPVCSCCAQ